MLKLLKIFLCATTVFVFAGCGREPLPVYPPVIPQLAQYLEIDSVAGSLPDTTKILKFQYDDQKRLAVLNSFYSTDTADQLANFDKYIYQYTGSDTFPVRMIYQMRKESGGDITTYADTTYFVYDPSGKLQSDSSNRNVSDNFGLMHYISKRKYSLAGFNFTVAKIDTGNGFNNQSIDSIFFTKSNSNIITAQLINYYLPDTIRQYSSNHIFSYDNGINPFYLIRALYPLFRFLQYETSPLSLLQPNNVVSIVQDNSITESANETVIYSYYVNNFPSVFYSTRNNELRGAVTTRHYKGVFIYN